MKKSNIIITVTVVFICIFVLTACSKTSSTADNISTSNSSDLPAEETTEETLERDYAKLSDLDSNSIVKVTVKAGTPVYRDYFNIVSEDPEDDSEPEILFYTYESQVYLVNPTEVFCINNFGKLGGFSISYNTPDGVIHGRIMDYDVELLQGNYEFIPVE